MNDFTSIVAQLYFTYGTCVVCVKLWYCVTTKIWGGVQTFVTELCTRSEFSVTEKGFHRQIMFTVNWFCNLNTCFIFSDYSLLSTTHTSLPSFCYLTHNPSN